MSCNQNQCMKKNLEAKFIGESFQQCPFSLLLFPFFLFSVPRHTNGQCVNCKMNTRATGRPTVLSVQLFVCAETGTLIYLCPFTRWRATTTAPAAFRLFKRGHCFSFHSPSCSIVATKWSFDHLVALIYLIKNICVF